MTKKINILHIVPSSFGGGVETAANSFLKYSCRNFNFKVYFLIKTEVDNALIDYLYAYKKIKRLRPDIILTSLWKSNLFTVLFKLFNPKTKFILFLHSTKNKHFIDGFITTISALFAYEIWSDSKETLIQRIQHLYIFKKYKNFLIKKYQKKIISFILYKINFLEDKKCSPSFIYWGRICPYKNIDKAIKLFSEIHKLDRNATFIIIGPDFGAKDLLKNQIDKLMLKDNVLLFDFMSFDKIKSYANNCSFFIQLSSYEGMAMSVSESMQLGLIPLVTDVGQIKSYCKDMNNSLIYKNNDQEIIFRVFQLIKSKEKYEKIRRNILMTWENHPTYREDLIKAFNKLVL